MSGIYDEYEPYYSNDTIPKCGLKPLLLNKDAREIVNKNDIFALGILMQRKYSKPFIENGTLKFGCPQRWITYAKNHNPGKGDMQEGVFAAYEPNDNIGIMDGLNKNPNSYHIRLVSYKSDLVYLVNKNVLTLPTYCFYIIKFGDFKIVRYGGSEYTAFLHIPYRYFRGLADWKSWQDSTKDNYEDQYVFILIYDHKIFLDKIFKKLTKIGFDINDIICKPIEYTNMNIPFIKKVEHPYELFFKNEQFSDQHEGRIVVNSSNLQKRNFLLNNPFNIGALTDICVIYDQYPSGGFNMFIDLDVK